MASELQKVEGGQFQLAVVGNPDLKEAIMANFEGADEIRFERIKMPSGGGLTFEVLDENGEIAPVPELKGIIVDKYRVNTRWAEKFTGEVSAPLCVALDARHGVGDPGGDCRTCPLNQWGSADDGRGKVCKNLHRVYLLPLDRALPKIVTLPPTSLGNFDSYMRLLAEQSRPYYFAVTRIKLEKAVSSSGITYSKAAFSKLGDVPVESVPGVRAYIADMKPLMRAVKIEAADYNVEDSEADSQDSTEPF